MLRGDLIFSLFLHTNMEVLFAFYSAFTMSDYDVKWGFVRFLGRERQREGKGERHEGERDIGLAGRGRGLRAGRERYEERGRKGERGRGWAGVAAMGGGQEAKRGGRGRGKDGGLLGGGRRWARGREEERERQGRGLVAACERER
ncbi:hypothetical protein CKAN_01382700 [Cinnamomum micranthum f. kanehirae]|uniref:Uncharacterized protein n=1 Tax=Cinnamomum micranthum f. kanehirae TaxID=337451 RepID=A0A443P2L3_9MAGN|nr:hypothetical protein CKAN_01382700 [Cinnamomum micranthum f. kanehirae]